MLKSSFFNATLDAHGEPDRIYDAEVFAKYFSSFVGNGVFPNPSTNFQVFSNGDMSVNYKSGIAWINGYFAYDDSQGNIRLDVADGMLNRIDRICLRLNLAKREIEIVVKKGDLASSPKPKAVERNAEIYDIALADVFIARGVTSITESAITDLRLNKEVCGIVHGLVEQIDTSTLFKQYEDGFNRWFENLKTTLDGDVASNLQNQIYNKENKGTQRVITLSRNSWYGNTYDLESLYPSSRYNLTLELSANATEQQILAWSKAWIISDDNYNKLKAAKTVPDVDIPVKIVYREK